MLRIEIIGNLGSDPEQRYTQDGKSQVSIRVRSTHGAAARTATRSSAQTGPGTRDGRQGRLRVTLSQGPARVRGRAAGHQRVDHARGRAAHLVRHLGRRRREPVAAGRRRRRSRACRQRLRSTSWRAALELATVGTATRRGCRGGPALLTDRNVTPRRGCAVCRGRAERVLSDDGQRQTWATIRSGLSAGLLQLVIFKQTGPPSGFERLS